MGALQSNPDSDSPAPSGTELVPGVRVPEAALRWQFSRSSGPGGQNVNKVNTKAELWIALPALSMIHADALQRLRKLAGKRLTKADELHLVGETGRTQEDNRHDVLERLRAMLILAMQPVRKRRKTRPTAGSRQRRLQSKRKRGEIKSNRRGESKEW